MGGLSGGRQRNLGCSLFDFNASLDQFIDVSGEDLRRGNAGSLRGVGVVLSLMALSPVPFPPSV